MIRIHFTAADFARVRFAPRPAPLQELNLALGMLCRRDDPLLLGRWRQRMLRSLPRSAEPLADLVPGFRPPVFLDEFSDSLHDGLDSVRATRPTLVRSEMERVYALHGSPAPSWVRALHEGDAGAWHTLRRAQHSAFDTVLGPVWPLVQDLHRAEFTRHALTVAEHGLAGALADLLPGAQLHGSTWELPAPVDRETALGGRGLVLVPTFHWTGHPVLADLPDHPLYLTYPAGPGLPLPPAVAGTSDDALAGVLGRTRADVLLLLAEELTTSALARRLRVSNATASAHAAALRAAGLITTARAGRAVLHRRTALGTLLVRQRSGTRDRAPALPAAGPESR
ncbi:helix-turn-helix domain-containing protein [Streptomyces sp. CT34]|uniref:helix-turn-helix domain-containing protein n=1 Tax=Streptomyces sp. CT34 TaxID=1553907 RepID=UPI00068C21BF|nr:helix-turn-helix domain-containing protein [Streptomyces sp. CT34]